MALSQEQLVNIVAALDDESACVVLINNLEGLTTAEKKVLRASLLASNPRLGELLRDFRAQPLSQDMVEKFRALARAQSSIANSPLKITPEFTAGARSLAPLDFVDNFKEQLPNGHDPPLVPATLLQELETLAAGRLKGTSVPALGLRAGPQNGSSHVEVSDAGADSAVIEEDEGPPTLDPERKGWGQEESQYQYSIAQATPFDLSENAKRFEQKVLTTSAQFHSVLQQSKAYLQVHDTSPAKVCPFEPTSCFAPQPLLPHGLVARPEKKNAETGGRFCTPCHHGDLQCGLLSRTVDARRVQRSTKVSPQLLKQQKENIESHSETPNRSLLSRMSHAFKQAEVAPQWDVQRASPSQSHLDFNLATESELKLQEELLEQESKQEPEPEAGPEPTARTQELYKSYQVERQPQETSHTALMELSCLSQLRYADCKELLSSLMITAGPSGRLTKTKFITALGAVGCSGRDKRRFGSSEQAPVSQLYDVLSEGKKESLLVKDVFGGLSALCSGSMRQRIKSAISHTCPHQSPTNSVTLTELQAYLRSLFAVLTHYIPNPAKCAGITLSELSKKTAVQAFQDCGTDVSRGLDIDRFIDWFSSLMRSLVPSQAPVSCSLIPMAGGVDMNSASINDEDNVGKNTHSQVEVHADTYSDRNTDSKSRISTGFDSYPLSGLGVNIPPDAPSYGYCEDMPPPVYVPLSKLIKTTQQRSRLPTLCHEGETLITRDSTKPCSVATQRTDCIVRDGTMAEVIAEPSLERTPEQPSTRSISQTLKLYNESHIRVQNVFKKLDTCKPIRINESYCQHHYPQC